MKTVYLHGRLGAKFNKKWELDAQSIPEAFHAIDCNCEGFLSELMESINQGSEYLILKKDISLI